MEPTFEQWLSQQTSFFAPRDAFAAGYARSQFEAAIRAHKIERIGHGLYLSATEMEDAMARIQTRYPKAIYSHGTALYLHGLSDRVPIRYDVTVPAGSNMRRLYLMNEPVEVFTIKQELHGLGIIETKTMFGNPIRAYDVERALCDALRSRSKMDIALITQAVTGYMQRRDRNLPKLMAYAEAFHVQKTLRPYIEVLQ